MTPDKYNRVKDIFLAACDKPADELEDYVRTACAGDAEIQREVEGLLKEHTRETQVMPSEPEGPLGSMSAILSRANIELGPKTPREHSKESKANRATAHDGDHNDPTTYIDDTSTGGQDTRSGIVDAGRFMAGTVAAGRYRIIELLGRGGMGEVYRADDITLNQSVALKFLPALFGSDQKWLERFRNEVRLARQVTHPNVCRVFDIGEFQGEQFISMEYVDGENLGSLLRRIGRVPHDKAMQITRQLCAGLAAAHDRGVLHRDLKPANVMIDGRGYVRITDFGLAAPIDQMRADAAGEGAVRAGTPAYMSPEQLAGKPVTVRSDIYSLGLVMYEMFTGRRAFRAENLREYQKLHSSEDPMPPSKIIEDIDPIVERVIMRCLEKDPRQRPASAMAVSAALPGGNPLREILAAGETPSPEVVAAAGEAHGGMKPRTAIALLAAALACLVLFVAMAPKIFVVQQALRENPTVLTYKAQTLLSDLGYAEKPRDSAQGFEVNRAYYVHVGHEERGTDRLGLLSRARLGLVYFWYRQSPELLITQREDAPVVERDPAPTFPGMVEVRLDPLGRLLLLKAEPTTPAESVIAPDTAASPPATAERAAASQPASAPAEPLKVDWTPLLQAADMDLSRFKPALSQGAPPMYVDQRSAWEGTFADAPRDQVRVEAGAFHGRPVYFAVIGSWKEDQFSDDQIEILSVGRSNRVLQTVIILSLLLTGGFLAWRNYRSGRGDRQGALRMGVAFFILGFIVWLLRADHVPDAVFEFTLFQRGMGPVVYLMCLVWIFYMALEPYVRRIWPEMVISWSRLLAGRWFDPLVGRDVLAGAAIGIGSTLLSILEYEIPRWVGGGRIPLPLPPILSASLMLNATRNYSGLFSGAIVALYFGLILLLFLVLVRMVSNRRWVAAFIFVALFALSTAHYRVEEAWWHLGVENVLSLCIQGCLAILFLTLMLRHGLVAVIFAFLARSLLLDFPVTWDFSVWYSGSSLAGIIGTLLILGAGFYATMGGQLPHLMRAEPLDRSGML